jgi:beta-glucosidase
VDFVDGADPKAAADAARGADVAVVFATRWQMEGYDAPDLSLPDGQDGLISAVAAANPHTIVVLETGNPVLMPWLDKVPAVLEAWYPGARGGEAIAAILFGDVNPSGRLPISFPASEAQLPRPTVPGAGLDEKTPFAVDYPEGADVGYRGFEARGQKPLFPFGFGLSYTQFAYSDLKVTGGKTLHVSFTVKNVGDRTGAEVAQVYGAALHCTMPRCDHGFGGAAFGEAVTLGVEYVRRLIGWQTVTLKPGESRQVSITADPRTLAHFDFGSHRWLYGGHYSVHVGGSSASLPLVVWNNWVLTPQTITP